MGNVVSCHGFNLRFRAAEWPRTLIETEQSSVTLLLVGILMAPPLFSCSARFGGVPPNLADILPYFGAFCKDLVMFYEGLVMFYETLVEYYETLVEFYETLVEYYETLVEFYQTSVEYRKTLAT
jgi:hypothetical protein